MSRSLKKGFFFQKNLLQYQKKWVKTVFNKNQIILPEYINLIFRVYNGKTFIKINITDQMIGYKFGEFIYTRKKSVFKKSK